jgi:hypothetical protein
MIENLLIAYAIGFAYFFGGMVGLANDIDKTIEKRDILLTPFLWPFGAIEASYKLFKRYLRWRRQ